MSAPSVVWLRLDLRLDDNPALVEAWRRGAPVLPLFIWSPVEWSDWAGGTASHSWLGRSLKRLQAAIEARGSRLTLRQGVASEVLLRVCADCSAGAVFWNRRYEPAAMEIDEVLTQQLRKRDIAAHCVGGAGLVSPESLLTKGSVPFKVFTPFWRAAVRQQPVSQPLPAPAALPAPVAWPASVPLNALGLPEFGFPNWDPGESGAQSGLDRFLDDEITPYRTQRDIPDSQGTSRLSPHLHFGEISVRRVHHAVSGRAEAIGKEGAVLDAAAFVRQLYWREFAQYLLHHFPFSVGEALREEFAGFPWQSEPTALEAWQQGRTGYPIVDAGMRELLQTGWMHNRVRMVVASFLVKDLLIPWQHGAEWFWDRLVDADLGNNTLGWQWVAGCGADAAPYFRIFNPVLQGQKYDPEGGYVRRFVPELAKLPTRYIHSPWAASSPALAEAGLVLGGNYPARIVVHAHARERALAAYAMMRGKRQKGMQS